MAKDNKQAKKMAAAGKSAAQIKAKTGVGSQTAQKYVAKQAPAPAPKFSGQVTGAAKEAQSAKVQQTLSTPQVGQRPGEVATVYAPGVTPTSQPPTSQPPTSKPTPEIKGLNQGLKVASKGGGISKGNLNSIMETGKDQGQIIRKLDQLNTKLQKNDKGSINLKSGAANMLIRQANKSRSDIFGAARRPFEFGTGSIGQQLSDMSGLNTPSTIPNRMMADGGWTPKGEAFEPEFLDRGMDLTGRGATGKTVRGVGKGYELPKRYKGEKEGPYDGMEIGPPDLNGPGPLANPNTNTELGNQNPAGGGGDGDGDNSTLPTGPEEEVDRSASSGAGGLDLASWATGFKKARSARQKSGRSAQGLASQKKNPFKSWA